MAIELPRFPMTLVDQRLFPRVFELVYCCILNPSSVDAASLIANDGNICFPLDTFIPINAAPLTRRSDTMALGRDEGQPEARGQRGAGLGRRRSRQGCQMMAGRVPIGWMSVGGGRHGRC